MNGVRWNTMNEILKVNYPLIPLDFPDPDIIRVGDVYYMASTTMHFFPGCEILQSFDLVNWEHLTYVYERLDETTQQQLLNHENIYGQGMWAPSFRYHKGIFYLVFAANDTQKTYLFRTHSLQESWDFNYIEGFYHDCSLLFDDDRVFLVYGNGTIHLLELTPDLRRPKENGFQRILLSDETNPYLNYEGSHMYKINGYYYLFLVHSLADRWFRTQACFMSDSLQGEFKGGDVFQDDHGYCHQGIAQGGIVEGLGDDWYAVLFQDYGAVGRLPVLVPVSWENHFPVFGKNGKIPDNFSIPKKSLGKKDHSLVGSDQFDRLYSSKSGFDSKWSFNHQPQLELITIEPEKQSYVLKTDRIASNILEAVNTLTQRMTYPACIGEVTVDVSDILDGDVVGISAFQGAYGFVGVTKDAGNYYVIMQAKTNDKTNSTQRWNNQDVMEYERVHVFQSKLKLRIEVDFENMRDVADFYYYEYEEKTWRKIGITHSLFFGLDHFTGCRFGLFYFSTKESGGQARFSQFHYITGEKMNGA